MEKGGTCDNKRSGIYVCAFAFICLVCSLFAFGVISCLPISPVVFECV